MMRNLAKSMFRFTWAMGILGVDQMSSLVSRDRNWNQSTHSLDAVSHAASSQLGETLKKVYDAGDHLQEGVIESVSSLAGASASNPRQAMNESWEKLDRTWSTVRSDLGGKSGGENQGSGGGR